jgi:L-alanine-DL-glutamate epimerase-like enolase superfamily enzyme
MIVLVDPNQGHQVRDGIEWDFNRALETGRALQDMGCYWLEEPLKRDDLAGHAELARQLDMPIAGAEGDHDYAKFAEMMRMDAYDILNPESLTLGITGMRKVGAIAELFGKPVVPHNGNLRIGNIAHLHLCASWQHAPYIEVIHDPPVAAYQHYFSVFNGLPPIDNEGNWPLPQGPGLGVEINPDFIDYSDGDPVPHPGTGG